MKPKKIAFFGPFGQQNLGNECTLQAIIYNVRQYLPDSELKCICTGPDDTSARYNISAFPISERFAKGFNSKVLLRQNNRLMRLIRKVLIRIPMELLHWVKAFKILKGTHMLVVTGTGFLSDYGTSFSGWPYYIFKWSIIAKLCRCKLVFVSVGTAPMYHLLTRWFIKSALSLADYRSYRDDFSKKYLESIGFERNNDPVYPDLAFSLPRDMIPECKNNDRKRPVIAVGIKDYYGVLGKQHGGGEAKYGDFIEKLATFVTWLVEHKYTVQVIMGDVLYDKSPNQELIKLLERRGVRYDDERIINEPTLLVEKLLIQLETTDMVVAPRFHNIVLALMLNKPVISFSYHEKMASLMAEVGLGDYCQHTELDVDRLIEQFTKLEKNAENLKPYIKQKTEEYRRALNEQYALIFNDIWHA